MPEVDLKTSVCGVDQEKASESSIGDHHNPPQDKPDSLEAPAESFQLREEDELDWLDRKAVYFIDRNESQKWNSDSTSNHNLNPNSLSQRLSLNFTSNTSIIGLPKSQKSRFRNSKSWRHGRAPRPRLFPKKQSRSGISLTLTEPSSPKVSCIGRVRSNKGKNRRCSSGRPSTEVNSKPENKTGFWACLKAILGSLCGNDTGVDMEERQRPKDLPSPSPSSSPSRWSFAERGRKIPASAPMGEPPGLGGMKRFASGRRSESWAGTETTDLDLEDSVVHSDASDHQHNIWRRRDLDSLKKIDSSRDGECESPASV